MVVIPAGVAIGAAQAGLGIFGAISSHRAQQQEYANQVAFQDANARFAQWQAGFNARVADANAQQKYWVDTVNYNQQHAYVNSLRNFELIKAIRQAELVLQTREQGSAAYIRDSEAISQAYQEASMQDAVALQQYQWRALQARASVQAMGRAGQSVDRIVNDYARQAGDYATLQTINQNLRDRQYTRAQAGQVAQYLSRWNSQQFYEEQPYIDPVPPFAPLPTLLTPPPPSYRGAPPGGAGTALNIGSALLSGVQTGLQIHRAGQALKKKPSGKQGPGTPKER